ncbi:MAG: hypothetical protein HUJ98_01260, partial [Bacteroidaceae bacterium]|nr:hypothetical protein [Bacteroidaceae bacterium]
MFDTHLNLLRTMMVEGVVTVAQIDSENCIWSIIDGRLSYFDMKSLKRLNIPQSLSELIQDNPVEFISLGPEESFIVGMRGIGVYRYNKLTHTVEACITSALPDADTWLAYQSSKGTLWLSDRNNFFESYRRKNQTQSIQVDDNIYTIVPDHQHQIWFRSTTNLYCLNSRTLEFSIVNSGVFGEFLIDENDKLYVITNNNHLSVYSIREAGLEFDKEYVMNANILSVCRDNRNRIWMASPRSLGLIDEDGVVSIISTPDNAIITGLYEALPARELFLTTEKGTVYRLQGERFMPIELPVKNPTSFYMNDSDLVIGSYNEGVTFYNLKSKAKQVLTTDDNLGDIHVKTIL